jgi:hypothetical protein
MRLPHFTLLASRVPAWLFQSNVSCRQQSTLTFDCNMPTINVLTATATDLQSQLNSSAISSRHLIQTYLSQVTKHNDYLRAVIAIAPETLLYARADALDDERRKGHVRGPLHGIPVLLKVTAS